MITYKNKNGANVNKILISCIFYFYTKILHYLKNNTTKLLYVFVKYLNIK